MSSAAATHRTAEVHSAVNPDPFEAGLRKIARLLRPSIPQLGERDSDFLYDLAREETRYPMPTVRRLCALSRRSRNPLARDAFAQLIRFDCMPIDVDAGVTATFDIEQRANGPEDIAARQFELDKNPITYARLKDALKHQIEASELKLLALVRWGAKNGLEVKQNGRGR